VTLGPLRVAVGGIDEVQAVVDERVGMENDVRSSVVQPETLPPKTRGAT
jgi:hypothetical protein